MTSNNVLGGLLSFVLTFGFSLSAMQAVAATDIANEPLYTSRSVTPLNLLVMGRDHKLYYEAYNDASDLDGDGVIDMRFKPSITYFGYFNSGTCYTYSNNMFVPVSAALNVADKDHFIAKPNVCNTANNNARWSGNFLNYVATSRIDALRKVLYGGFRHMDLADTSGSAAQTVLERSYTPQDGHSWGKEYTSTADDGYNISDYAPLAQPVAGTRHLIANTNLNNATGTPLIRVLNDSNYRIWEWVSREAPVAGSSCLSGDTGCTASAGTDTSHPANFSEFSTLVNRFSSQVLTGTPVDRNQINKTANGALSVPGGSSTGQADNYISVLRGRLVITTGGNYRFAINGDDSVAFAINGAEVIGWYGGHAAATSTNSNNNIRDNWGQKSGSIALAAGQHEIIFYHNEVGGGDSYQLAWQRDGGTWSVIPTSGFQGLKLTVLKKEIPASSMTDYHARVQVCKKGILEENCKRYVRTVGANEYESFKPEGILQQYGNNPDAPKMLFGLLTGSYVNNIQGGVLRRSMGNISSEINQNTGQLDTSVNGVIGNINKLKITGYSGSSYAGCGLLARPIKNNECHMWGNPIAEMMYEGVRYFAGKTAPTAAFTYSSSTYDDQLSLSRPAATWVDPYSLSGVQQCSAPVQTVISDINPSYDTDQLPGSHWNTSFSSDLTVPMNVGTLGDKIWRGEYGSAAKQIFIGETNGTVSSGPTAKAANTFKNTRGLSPEEPTKQGGYYAASVAHYGWLNDLNPRAGEQKLSTYSIALASPLPEFRIPVGNNIVTLVPFGKSVKHGGDTAWNTYAPTNTIVDFYVESMSSDGREGIFRVNFEDVEQGNDHDMDAIARYTYKVNANNTLTINISSDYAAGSVVQHMGYVISGTTRDGVYLEVRDVDTSESDDYLYSLDTPPGVWAGQPRGNTKLPLAAERTFSPSSTPAASLLKNPLWYAAKWGGFKDRNGNGIPDLKEEWTSSTAASPDPDNYFLVTNALKLGEQLDKAFSEILKSLSSSSAAAASTGEFVSGKSQVVQARFRTDNWSGELVSYDILDNSDVGNISWNSSDSLPQAADRSIFTLKETAASSIGAQFSWNALNDIQRGHLRAGGASEAVGQERLSYLRGDSSREERFNGPYRNRVNGPLGDIVNSDPVYVDSLESALAYVPEQDKVGYSQFRQSLDTRPEMVYAGTNGGLLHAVCADRCGSAAKGKELFAYVPNALMPNLYELTLPSYSHRYYVDGPTTVSDAKIENNWKTILLGALGAGGKGLYALDVTAPQSFSETHVLWELTAAHEAQQLGIQPAETDLGYTIGKPQIVRLQAASGSVAVVSNGFNGASGHASLFIVDLATGNILKRLRVSGAGSGLASPTVHDQDKDGVVDYVYAGDDTGKLWRFDLRGASVDDWKVDFSNVALFDAGTDQPITSAPYVYTTTDADGNDMTMVYVGTGRYFGQADKTDMRPQGVYAIHDKWFGSSQASFTVSLTRTSLVEQSIVFEVDNPTLVDGNAGYAIRVTSANEVNYDSRSGWYMTLIPPSGTRQGERVVATPTVRHGRLIFTTLIPPVDSCEFGGSSWLMEMDAVSGARFANSVLDINNDGRIDGNDMLLWEDEQWTIGGRKFNELIRSPAFVGFGDKEAKYISGSSGGLTKVWEEGGASLPRGRLSWRQLE